MAGRSNQLPLPYEARTRVPKARTMYPLQAGQRSTVSPPIEHWLKAIEQVGHLIVIAKQLTLYGLDMYGSIRF